MSILQSKPLLKVILIILPFVIAGASIRAALWMFPQNNGGSEQKAVSAHSRALPLSVIMVPVLRDSNERDYVDAVRSVLGGNTEVRATFGRIDILNDHYAIEVDFLNKYHEGIGQALHYGKAANKIPTLALILRDGVVSDKVFYIHKLCVESGVNLIIVIPSL